MTEGLRSRAFQVQGRTYEVRVVAEGRSVVVRAYLDGRPANPFSYSITSDTQHDLAKVRGVDAIETLMEFAQQDVFRAAQESA